jgi:hypothetical protein
MKLRNLLVAFAAFALFVPSVAFADANFVIIAADELGEGFFDPEPRAPLSTNPGTTLGAQRLYAFQAAADAWGRMLDSDVPILIEAALEPLFCDPTSAVLGAAGPRFVFSDFPNELAADTWHASALANSRAGIDLLPPNATPALPNGSDIVAVFTSEIRGNDECLGGLDFYYGTDGNAPSGTIDFYTVVLHEIAHGLGFTTFVDRVNGSKLDDMDDTYMVNLEDHSTGDLWSEMTDLERLNSRTDTGDLHWVGNHVVAASGVLTGGTHPSGHVLMFAPDPEQRGSSISHFDTTVSPNELMEPFLNSDASNRITTELLQDIGWNLDAGMANPCVPSATVLCIDDEDGDRRFRAQVFFQTVQGGGGTGDAAAIPLSPLGVNDGGLFTFFSPENPEMLIKVLNGCPVNDNYWVFYAATTNVGFTVTVTDTVTGQTFVSSNPDQNAALPVQNTSAFPCDDDAPM